MSNNPEKKGVSAIDFFCIGFGAIVGVGWAVAINGWMSSCGGRGPGAVGWLGALGVLVLGRVGWPKLPHLQGFMAATSIKRLG